MKKDLDAMKKIDQPKSNRNPNPVANQSQLTAQAYSKNQKLMHTNREQRA